MRRSPVLYRCTRKVARWVFSLVYDLEVKRKEVFPDRGPVIILPKHQYWTDVPIVSLSFKPMLYFVAKKELFRYPLIRHFLSLLGGLPIDRKQSIRTLDSFKNLLALLRDGEKIVIFPEGTYFRDVVGLGKSRLLQLILRFQSQLQRQIPFVPVGIRYERKKGWRRRVEVNIGHPLYAEAEQEVLSLTDRVMEEIGRLCRMPRCSTKIVELGPSPSPRGGEGLG